jgi:hypothetical protein
MSFLGIGGVSSMRNGPEFVDGDIELQFPTGVEVAGFWESWWEQLFKGS